MAVDQDLNKPIRDGDIDQRVSIEAATYRRNEYGEPVATWAEAWKRWAGVAMLSGVEVYRARQVHATATVVVMVRYLEGLTTQHRVNWRGRILEVGAVLGNKRSGKMILLCSETPDAG